jgi:hypothetical protein
MNTTPKYDEPLTMTMTRPTDKQIFEGVIATYYFDDGILVSLSKNPKRTVENISGNVVLVKRDYRQ